MDWCCGWVGLGWVCWLGCGYWLGCILVLLYVLLYCFFCLVFLGWSGCCICYVGCGRYCFSVNCYVLGCGLVSCRWWCFWYWWWLFGSLVSVWESVRLLFLGYVVVFWLGCGWSCCCGWCCFWYWLLLFWLVCWWYWLGLILLFGVYLVLFYWWICVLWRMWWCWWLGRSWGIVLGLGVLVRFLVCS